VYHQSLGNMDVLAIRPASGGSLLGLGMAYGATFRPVCVIENRSYAVATLIKNIESGYLPEFPIWDQVETFNCIPWCGKVDLITGVFLSEGFEDTTMLESVCRILAGVEAPRALFETRSEFIRSKSFLGAVSRFQSMGFQVEAEEISARQLGFPHGRRRLFLSLTRDSSGKPVANPRTPRLEGPFWSEENTQENAGGQVTRQPSDSHQDLERVSRITQRFPYPPVPRDHKAWSEILESTPHLSPALPEQTSSQFRGVANGFSNRLDRLWTIGDDSVPATWFAAVKLFA